MLAGIPCPEPIKLRQHVLVMSFVGKDGWPAPRLKDASIDAAKLPALYDQLVHSMRVLFQRCRLVHADLSEYNILYWRSTLYIIDVSQSVEHDHPHALDFLRTDVTNVNDFFSKRGVAVFTVRELFDFVTSLELPNDDDGIRALMAQKRIELDARPADYAESHELRMEEEVFKRSFIPRSLFEVVDAERDSLKVFKGNADDLLYRSLTGVASEQPTEGAQVASPSSTADAATDAAESAATPSAEPDSASGSESDSEEEADEAEGASGPAALDKKAHKKAVKEANRERRKNKLPKHVKKRAEKNSKKAK